MKVRWRKRSARSLLNRRLVLLLYLAVESVKEAARDDVVEGQEVGVLGVGCIHRTGSGRFIVRGCDGLV